MSRLTSGFMEAQRDVSVEAQAEVVVENIDRKLRKKVNFLKNEEKVFLPNRKRETDLICLLLVPLVGSNLRVGLHVQVPPVQLDDVPVLHMRQDLCDGLVCVALRHKRAQSRTKTFYLPRKTNQVKTSDSSESRKAQTGLNGRSDSPRPSSGSWPGRSPSPEGGWPREAGGGASTCPTQTESSPPERPTR